MNDENAAILALMRLPSAGRTAIYLFMRAARKTGDTLAELLQRPAEEIVAALPSGREQLSELAAALDQSCFERARATLAALDERGIRALRVGTNGFPAHLAASSPQTCPPLLFALGNISLLDESGAAVVGARKVSSDGVRAAVRAAAAFGQARITVVSGGAQGVDTAAHKAALDAGGGTVVVLPQGIMTYDPHAYMRDALKRGDALLVSEFEPALPWRTHAAVTRNSTIAGLVRCLCVIEPRKRGGSIRAARHGLREGKPVFVLPARDDTGFARMILESGAMPLLNDKKEVDAKRLVATWRSTPTPPVQPQRELF